METELRSDVHRQCCGGYLPEFPGKVLQGEHFSGLSSSPYEFESESIPRFEDTCRGVFTFAIMRPEETVLCSESFCRWSCLKGAAMIEEDEFSQINGITTSVKDQATENSEFPFRTKLGCRPPAKLSIVCVASVENSKMIVNSSGTLHL